MDVFISTPASSGSTKGNRVTAERWAAHLRALGAQVQIAERWDGVGCDMLLALHARRSHDSIARWHAARPQAPLLVALTGTDLYEDLGHAPEVDQALDWATRIIVLQERALESLPVAVRHKAVSILQSLDVDVEREPAVEGIFEVVIMGHLRDVKDPLRAAEAARLLPASSRVRILQAGAALSAEWEERARAEEARNPRYRWLGPLPRPRSLSILSRARVALCTSFSEGGANAVIEAIALDVPVIASAVDGNLGILGEDYPGLFKVGDTASLAGLLERAESEPAFLAELRAKVRKIAPRVSAAAEREGWRSLIAGLQCQDQKG